MWGSSLVAASALTACTAPSKSANRAQVQAAPAEQFGARRDTPLHDTSASIYSAPYTLSDDCVLSEDHFLLKLGDYNPEQDQIVGYPQNSNYVPEAIMVLGSGGRNGALVQLYHDWTHDQAWAVASVSVSGGAVEDVKHLLVGRPQRADHTVGPLHVFYQDDNGTNHIKQLDDSSWQLQPDPGWTGFGLLRQSTGPTGGVLFYSFCEDPDNRTLYWWHVNADDTYANGVVHFDDWLDPLSARARLCALPGFGGQWAMVMMDTNNTAVVARQATVAPTGTNQSVTVTSFKPMDGRQLIDPNTKQTLGLLGLVEMFSMDETQPPMALVTDQNERLWSLTTVDDSLIFTPSGSDVNLEVSIAARALAASEGGPPANADKALDVYVRTYDDYNNAGVQNNTVDVIHQVSTGNPTTDSLHPTFTPAVPLLPRIGVMAIPSGRGSNAGFIAMDLDGSLQLMTVQPVPADPATGAPAGLAWVGADIHLPATEVIQVSSYRVQLTLTDVAGLPVVLSPIQVSCTQQVPALCNGAAVALGPGQVTLQTNSRGQVTLAIPADGLSCPTLTVVANGASATVQPSANVNAYMTGSATLNALPPLAAGSHITATNTLSADQFATVQIAAHGATAASSVSRTLASQQRRLPPRLTMHTVHKGALTAEQARLGSLWDDFAHDVVQAVKSGAAEVSSITKKAATSVEHAVVTVLVDIGNGIKQQLAITVYDLETAAAAIHSVINQIGAALDAAIDWLEAAIGGLFTDTALLAAQYDTWIHDGCTFAQKQIQAFKGKADNWFANQQKAVDAQFAQFRKDHGSGQMSGLVPSKNSLQAPQLRPTPRRQLGDAAPTPNPGGAHSNWLLDKIEQVFESPPSMDKIDAIETALNDLTSSGRVATAVGDFTGAFNSAIDGLKAAIEDPKDLGSKSLGLFIDALQQILDGAITLADLAVDLVLDLLEAVVGAVEAIIDTSLGQLPIIGPLLHGTALENLTLGRLACLLFAFPAMLAYHLANDGARPSWLQSTSSVTARSIASVVFGVAGSAPTLRRRSNSSPPPPP